MTEPREDRAALHAIWIVCFAAVCWIPVGMWASLLIDAYAATPQDRLGYGIAAGYMSLIAGALGWLLGLSGVALSARRAKGMGRNVLIAGTVVAFLPAAFALVMMTIDGLIY